MDSKWSDAIEADFKDWRQTSTPPEFQHLKFEEDPDKDDAKDDEAESDAGTRL
jgi:hypothetical protein